MKEENGSLGVMGGIGHNGVNKNSTQGCIMNVRVHAQAAAALASTDTSSDSVVTGGALPPQLTPQHSPRESSPAGFVLLPCVRPGSSLYFYEAQKPQILTFYRLGIVFFVNLCHLDRPWISLCRIWSFNIIVVIVCAMSDCCLLQRKL
jgi:hypothetical protein